MNMQTQPAAPLATFSQHDGELEVIEIFDEDAESNRMCELGFCPGKTVSIISQGNPAILSVAGTRLAVGFDLLSRVYVRPLS
ncbi:MAG: ferrous iron transport protein A [Planctomycetes bacterium]|nr:ferrous iron transport protein A [Planctomycetota bacterium]